MSLATPVVMKQRGVAVHVGSDEVLGFLDRFVERDATISSTAGGASSTTNTGANTTTNTGLALLRRVQRDFKGLPPQE